MTNNTQNQPLPTYRDGELDSDYLTAVRKQKLANAVSHTTALGLTFASKLGEYATEVFTPVYLDLQDARLGTTMRDEYFEKRRQAAIAHIREIVEL